MRVKGFALAGLVLFVLAATAMPAFAREAGEAAPNPIDPLALAARWAHVLAAIFMLGGAGFLRFIIMPAVTEVYGPEGHQRLRPAVMRRWRWVVHGSIGLFLVSGFYNYIMVTGPKHPADGLYHALFGIKFLLSIAVFGLVSMLISTREKPNALRRNTPVWMAVTISLAVLVVLIGGVMKLR